MPIITLTTGNDLYQVNTVPRTTVRALAGNDTVTGAVNADTLFGNEGDDSLTGGGGNDLIDVGEGIDRGFGGEGDDTLIAAGFSNSGQQTVLRGGSGRDTLTIGAGHAAFGEAGDDTIVLLLPSGLSVYPSPPRAEGWGGDGNDRIVVAAGRAFGDAAGSAYGEAGDDTLSGNGLLDGGDGRDDLAVEDDTALGGADDDTITVASTRTQTIYSGPNNSQQRGTGFGFGEAGDDRIETRGAGGVAQGGDGDDTLIAAPDSVAYPDGGSALSGGAGDDSVLGSALDDLLAPGAGNDTVTGGGGFNTLDYRDAGSAVFVDLRAGTATKAASGADQFSGIQRVLGSVGDDVLFGGVLADQLFGDDGNDRLRGKTGADTLTGGLGRNVFELTDARDSRPDAPDVITDFRRGVDVLDFRKLDADPRVAGLQALTFIGAGAFTGAGAELRYAIDGSGLLVSLDRDGDRLADAVIQLRYVVALDAADLVLRPEDVRVSISLTPGDDLYQLRNRPNQVVLALGGDDTVTGSSYSDVILGGAGSDLLRGGGGDDSLAGGTGDGGFVEGQDTVFGGDGNDTVNGGDFGQYAYGEAGRDLILVGEESFAFGADGDDTITSTAVDFGSTIEGGAGSDTLTLTQGGDVFGNEGDDTIDAYSRVADRNDIRPPIAEAWGDAGNDRITVGGRSIAHGGTGDDTLSGDGSLYGDAGDDVLTTSSNGHGGEGDDTVAINSDYAYYDDSFDPYVSVAVGYGEAGDDLMTSSGLGGLMLGGEGNDTLIAAPDAALYGADVVSRLDGGLDTDLLVGGDSRDMFVLRTIADSRPDAPDTVVGFAAGEDVLDLGIIGFDVAVSVTDLVLFVYRGNAAFTAAGDAELRWEASGPDLLVSLDVDGDGAADGAVILQGVTTLAEADLLL